MTRTRLPVDAAVLARVQTLLNGRDALTRPAAEDRPKVKVTAQADATEMLIYDEISWYGVSAVDFAAALTGVSGPLHLRVNSPGGDVFDALAIYNMLLDYDGQVTVTVDGLAASAASFIAMAGERVTMNRGAKLMIHDASGLCIGNAAEMNAMAALLDMVSGTIADIYAARTGTAAEEWRQAMRAETWYGAAEAVEAGLADEMVPLERDGEGESMTSAYAATVRERLIAACFPYGMGDTTVPYVEAVAAAQQPAADDTPTEDAGDPSPPGQVPAPDPPLSPVAAHPLTPGPAPAPPGTAVAVDVAAAAEPGPDPWAQLVAHLLQPPAPPSADDLLTHLREA